jgi:four helix bundle protein
LWRVAKPHRAAFYAAKSDIMKQSSVESGRSRAFRFERIEAWQLARAFNRSVYRATRGFPKDEMFALTSQIRRASVSVSSNIAEGSGRNSDADFAHFLEIAYGSLMEVVSQLFIALDESYLTEAQFEALADEADVLAGKIVALSKALGRKPRIAAAGSRR